MNKIKQILSKSVILILLGFLTFFLIGTFFWKAVFCMVKYGDQPNLLPQDFGIYFIYLAFAVFLNLIIYKFSKLLERFSPKYVVTTFLILITFIQLFIIFSFRINLTADWGVAQSDGLKILNNDFSPFQIGGYIHSYPNNIGITLYSMIFSFFPPDNLFTQRIFNVLFTNIISLSIYYLYCNIFKGKSKNYHLLLILLFFLPPFFISNLSYNDSISTMFYLLSVLFALKYYLNIKLKYLIISSIMLGLGNFVRPLGMIFLIAIIIFLFLKSTHIKWIALYIIISILLFVLPTSILSNMLLTKGIIKEPIGENSVPIIKWVNMGINKERYGYWDSGESYHIYLDQASSKKAESEIIFKNEITRKVNEMGFGGLIEMYSKKYVWLWTEGTYQSVYIGMSHSSPGGYIEPTNVSRFFDENLDNREPLKNYMYASTILQYIVISVGLVLVIKKKLPNDKSAELLFILIILGFIGFYSFWEIKPRYIFPIYPYLILLGYHSFNIIKNKFFSTTKPPTIYTE